MLAATSAVFLPINGVGCGNGHFISPPQSFLLMKSATAQNILSLCTHRYEPRMKLLLCLKTGALGKAPSKVTDALPEPVPIGATAASEEEEEEEEEDIEGMQSRLAALRS